MTALPEWIGDVLECGRHLPDELRDRAGAMGGEARAPLLSLVRDRAFRDDDAPGAGWAPVNALRLLGALGFDEETCAECLGLIVNEPDGESLDLVVEAASRTLASFGEAIVEPTLAAYATAGERARSMLVDVLSRCGARSDVVYDLLLSRFEADPDHNACFVAEYGDVRALAAVHRVFEATPLVDQDHLFANQVFFELEDAVLTLGGELSEIEKALCEAARAMRDAFMLLAVERQFPVARPARAAMRPGPNDPCVCGSGHKFKKCCVDVDAPTAAPPTRLVVPKADLREILGS